MFRAPRDGARGLPLMLAHAFPGSRRPPGDGIDDDRIAYRDRVYHLAPRTECTGYRTINELKNRAISPGFSLSAATSHVA